MAQQDTKPRPSGIHGSRQEMRAKWGGTCRVCGNPIHVGSTIYYFPKSKQAEHFNCTRRRTTTKAPGRPTKRRACPQHGWVNAVKRTDDAYICPICGVRALTEHEFTLLTAARNKARLLGQEE